MIFVTGGTGLVGTHLLFELLRKGEKVRALKRKSSDLQQVLKTFSFYTEKPKNLFNRIEWVDGDILDYFDLEKHLHGIDEIYHCAAIVSFSPQERQRMISNNVEGTSNVVNAALENGIKKMCHVSSVAALGKQDNRQAITEETNWSPGKKVSGYSESKFFSEAEIRRGIEEGLNAVIVNPSIILGPANWNSGSARMFKTVWDGIKFYTKGVTGYVDVNDVVRAMILLMEDANFKTCKNQRFLLNSENKSYQEIFGAIAATFKKPAPRYFANNSMLAIAWRVATLAGRLRGKPSLISRDSLSGANDLNLFDGNKITRMLNFEYTSVSRSVQQTASFFLKDTESGK